MSLLRLSCLASLLVFATVAFAQDGVSTAGEARTRYLSNLGQLPASRDVVVEDFINYHRHEIPRPRAGDDVALDLRWGGNRFSPNHDSVLQIGISTTLSHDRDHLRPLNLSLVIDKSGSMADDQKMDHVKQALATLISKLRPQDKISITAFDSDANVVFPTQPLGDGTAALEAINRLEPGSSTNLSDGLKLGYQEAMEGYEKDSTNRVILLTDGIANTGETNPQTIAQTSVQYNDRGIDLSTIGVGRDVNMDLLRELANSGRGIFHFVEDSADITKVFDDEEQSLVSPVASDPNLTIDCGPNYRIDHIFGYDPDLKDGKARIKLDTMNSGMTEVVLVDVKQIRGDDEAPLNVNLSYFDLMSGKEVEIRQESRLARSGQDSKDFLEDESVEKNYSIAVLAQAMHDMAADCERGKYREAESTLSLAIFSVGEMYPNSEDPDIERTLSTAEKYQWLLRDKNGDDYDDRDAETASGNLIPNPGFAMGNWGFTTDLRYTNPTDNCLWPIGYTIAPTFSNPQLHQLIPTESFAAPVQTGKNEQVMFANAGGTGMMTMWSTRIHCRPHTRYRISFQAISLSAGSDWIPSYEIDVNSFRSAPQLSAEDVYREISTEWDSGDEHTATISIMRLPMSHQGGIVGIADIQMVKAD